VGSLRRPLCRAHRGPAWSLGMPKAPGARLDRDRRQAAQLPRDRGEVAIEAAEHLKRKHPHSEVVVKA
jgi:hypothetical protein